MNEEKKNDLKWVVVIAVFAAWFLCSCKTKEMYTTQHDTIVSKVEVHDTLWRAIATHDTIRHHDSIVVYLDYNGAEQVKYVFRDKTKTIAIHDTVYKTITASDSSKTTSIADSQTTTYKKSPWNGLITILALLIAIGGLWMGITKAKKN